MDEHLDQQPTESDPRRAPPPAPGCDSKPPSRRHPAHLPDSHTAFRHPRSVASFELPAKPGRAAG